MAILVLADQVQGAWPVAPKPMPPFCMTPGVPCAPRRETYGYYQTHWRRWPEEPHPSMVPIEQVPTPAQPIAPAAEPDELPSPAIEPFDLPSREPTDEVPVPSAPPGVDLFPPPFSDLPPLPPSGQAPGVQAPPSGTAPPSGLIPPGGQTQPGGQPPSSGSLEDLFAPRDTMPREGTPPSEAAPPRQAPPRDTSPLEPPPRRDDTPPPPPGLRESLPPGRTPPADDLEDLFAPPRDTTPQGDIAPPRSESTTPTDPPPRMFEDDPFKDDPEPPPPLSRRETQIGSSQPITSTSASGQTLAWRTPGKAASAAVSEPSAPAGATPEALRSMPESIGPALPNLQPARENPLRSAARGAATAVIPAANWQTDEVAARQAPTTPRRNPLRDH